MPFARPTLTELRQQIAADVAAETPGVDALLRNSNLRIIADVLAAGLNGAYGYLDWIARQSVPVTCFDEALEGWAALIGVTRKAPAIAVGTVSFAATDGKILPAGSPITRSDGEPYVTTGAATASGGTVDATVQAVNTGAQANSDAGTAMVLGVGISGITSVGSALTDITGGGDVEDDVSLRSRMIAAYAAPPQGGSYADYQDWALAVPGVTRVWILPAATPGSIDIYFMMDIAEAANGGFPQGSNGVATLETRDTAATGDQLALANALFQVQPVHVIVYALAPSANTVDLTITGLSSASSTTKAQVEAAVASGLAFAASIGGVTAISEVERAISYVASTEGFAITLVTCSNGSVAGSAGNITSSAGYLPVLGTVTFS